MWNEELNLFTEHHTGLYIQKCLRDEELGRVATSCHFAVDCLCVELYAFWSRRRSTSLLPSDLALLLPVPAPLCLQLHGCSRSCDSSAAFLHSPVAFPVPLAPVSSLAAMSVRILSCLTIFVTNTQRDSFQCAPSSAMALYFQFTPKTSTNGVSHHLIGTFVPCLCFLVASQLRFLKPSSAAFAPTILDLCRAVAP